MYVNPGTLQNLSMQFYWEMMNEFCDDYETDLWIWINTTFDM